MNLEPASFFGKFGYLSEEKEEKAECHVKSIEEPSGSFVHSATFSSYISDGSIDYYYVSRLNAEGEAAETPAFSFDGSPVKPTITALCPFYGYESSSNTIPFTTNQYLPVYRYLTSGAPLVEHLVTFAPSDDQVTIRLTGADTLFWDRQDGYVNQTENGVILIKSPFIHSDEAKTFRFFSSKGTVEPKSGPYVINVTEKEATIDDALEYIAQRNGISKKLVLLTLASENTGVNDVFTFENALDSAGKIYSWDTSFVFKAVLNYKTSHNASRTVKVERTGSLRHISDPSKYPSELYSASVSSQNATLNITFEDPTGLENLKVAGGTLSEDKKTFTFSGKEPCITLSKNQITVIPYTPVVTEVTYSFYGVIGFFVSLAFPPAGIAALSICAFKGIVQGVIGASVGLFVVGSVFLVLGITLHKKRKRTHNNTENHGE